MVGSLSFKRLGAHTLQLKQMAVADGTAGRRHRLAAAFAFAEAWARRGGYGMIILNARLGAEAFYQKHGYAIEGEPFDDNTIPHIRMTKRTLGGKRMSLEVGDKAPSFNLRADGGGKIVAQRSQGQKGRALFLSKGRHLWLHRRGLRLPRLSPRLLQGEGCDRRHLARLGREPRQVQKEVRPHLPAHLR